MTVGEAGVPTALETGFTLIELLVVLTIMGLLAAVAVANLSAPPGFIERARTRASLAEALFTARAEAQRNSAAARVNLEKVGAGDLGYAPLLGSAGAPTAYPDGSTSGGAVTRDGEAVTVIDWMTGRVTDAPR